MLVLKTSGDKHKPKYICSDICFVYFARILPDDALLDKVSGRTLQNSHFYVKLLPLNHLMPELYLFEKYLFPRLLKSALVSKMGKKNSISWILN